MLHLASLVFFKSAKTILGAPLQCHFVFQWTCPENHCLTHMRLALLPELWLGQECYPWVLFINYYSV